jgi:hypothetical protein
MAVPTTTDAKTAHVNLMTDTIIANLPAESLRAVVRAVLTSEPAFTQEFERQATKYLIKTSHQSAEPLFAQKASSDIDVTNAFRRLQGRIRSMLGCGLIFQCLPLLTRIIDRSAEVPAHASQADIFSTALASVDGDIVQAVTAVQKKVMTLNGSRPFNSTENDALQALLQALVNCQSQWQTSLQDFVYARSLILVSSILGQKVDESVHTNGVSNGINHSTGVTNGPHSVTSVIETFQLGDTSLPRLFSGLWQLSSPSWGVAPQSKIVKQFAQYVDTGFTAFDMADHYGDAEVIFVRKRRRCTE